MRSPKEIRDTEFDPAARGYKTQDVDAFLSILADELEELLVEKAEMQTKMMMLAEKVEEYRQDESALRSALVSAERMKENLLQEAEQQKDIVLKEAQQKADRMVEEAQKSIEREDVTLKAMKQQVSSFKAEILGMYKHHLEVLSELPEVASEQEGYGNSDVSSLFPGASAATPVQQAEFFSAAEELSDITANVPVEGAQGVGVEPSAEGDASLSATYEGFAPREWNEGFQENQQAYYNPVVAPTDAEPAPPTEFATFGSDIYRADGEPIKTESRFEKLDFGENFTFGRD